MAEDEYMNVPCVVVQEINTFSKCMIGRLKNVLSLVSMYGTCVAWIGNLP